MRKERRIVIKNKIFTERESSASTEYKRLLEMQMK